MINFPPIEVIKIPIDFKQPPSNDLFLVPPPSGQCGHYYGPFEVDIKGDKCKCLKCGETVGAMFVLDQLMKQESLWNRTRLAYEEEMKRLDSRSSTKCRHCGKITRISRL